MFEEFNFINGVKHNILPHPFRKCQKLSVLLIHALSIFSLHDNPIDVDDLIIVSGVLLFFDPVLRHDQVLRPIPPLGNGRAVGLLTFAHHKLDRIVFTIACEECDSLIAGADCYELPLDVTAFLDELVIVHEHCVLRPVLVDHI